MSFIHFHDECLIEVGIKTGIADSHKGRLTTPEPIVTSHLKPAEFVRRVQAGADLAHLLHEVPEDPEVLIATVSAAVEEAAEALQELGVLKNSQVLLVPQAA